MRVNAFTIAYWITLALAALLSPAGTPATWVQTQWAYEGSRNLLASVTTQRIDNSVDGKGGIVTPLMGRGWNGHDGFGQPAQEVAGGRPVTRQNGNLGVVAARHERDAS